MHLTIHSASPSVFFLLLAGTGLAHAGSPPGTVLIAGGSYKPLYAKEAKPREVKPFFMDITQVTNGQFLDFVKLHPEWQRSKIQRTQADANYLVHWAGELDPGDDKLRDAPVTHVSWFAARAFCEAAGKRLPTQDEWEFVARADATRLDASGDPAFLRQVLEWYSKPASSALENPNSAIPNMHGVRGLHGLVWEWVHDFNSTMIIGDSRGDSTLDRRFFCGAGSLLGADVGNYAAYMRYAFRSSLKGDYCVGSLGFRGAKSLNPEAPGPRVASFSTLFDLPGGWRTQDDRLLNLAQLRGRVRIVTMGFTSCKYACPRIIGDMQRIERALGDDAGRVGFVFFSIDPVNDTPAKMSATLTERDLDARRWTFLVAPDETVRQLAVALNFKFQFIDGMFAHSNLIAVLDADGKVIHREESLGADIGPAVQAVRNLIAR